MILTLAEARLRGISLPDDDDAAQAAIDEQSGWLAQRIGPLDGERTETFYVGYGRGCSSLLLRRYTDSVTVVDGSTTLATDQFRLASSGSAVRRETAFYPIGWTGPYVTATYTPNDEDAVRGILYDLLALATEGTGPFESEQIGSYSYDRGPGTRIWQSRGALATSVLPRRPLSMSLDTCVYAVPG